MAVTTGPRLFPSGSSSQGSLHASQNQIVKSQEVITTARRLFLEMHDPNFQHLHPKGFKNVVSGSGGAALISDISTISRGAFSFKVAPDVAATITGFTSALNTLAVLSLPNRYAAVQDAMQGEGHSLEVEAVLNMGAVVTQTMGGIGFLGLRSVTVASQLAPTASVTQAASVFGGIGSFSFAGLFTAMTGSALYRAVIGYGFHRDWKDMANKSPQEKWKFLQERLTDIPAPSEEMLIKRGEKELKRFCKMLKEQGMSKLEVAQIRAALSKESSMILEMGKKWHNYGVLKTKRAHLVTALGETLVGRIEKMERLCLGGRLDSADQEISEAALKEWQELEGEISKTAWQNLKMNLTVIGVGLLGTASMVLGSGLLALPPGWVIAAGVLSLVVALSITKLDYSGWEESLKGSPGKYDRWIVGIALVVVIAATCATGGMMLGGVAGVFGIAKLSGWIMVGTNVAGVACGAFAYYKIVQKEKLWKENHVDLLSLQENKDCKELSSGACVSIWKKLSQEDRHAVRQCYENSEVFKSDSIVVVNPERAKKALKKARKRAWTQYHTTKNEGDHNLAIEIERLWVQMGKIQQGKDNEMIKRLNQQQLCQRFYKYLEMRDNPTYLNLVGQQILEERKRSSFQRSNSTGKLSVT